MPRRQFVLLNLKPKITLYRNELEPKDLMNNFSWINNVAPAWHFRLYYFITLHKIDTKDAKIWAHKLLNGFNKFYEQTNKTPCVRCFT